MTLENLPILLTLGCLFGSWCYVNWRKHRLMTQEVIYLTASEEKQLQGCFLPSVYYLKNLEYRAQEICCYGQLRSPNFKYSYDTISHNLKQAFGDRFLCYLQEEASANLATDSTDIFANSSELSNYCFHIVETSNLLSSRRSLKRLIGKSIISAILAIATLIGWGTSTNLIPQLNLAQSLPYAIAVSSIFILRAIAQYYVTHKYQIPFVPPLYMPWLGSFGLLASFQQVEQNAMTTKVTVKQQRQVLFDLGAWPIMAGLIASILWIVLGNWFLVPVNSGVPIIPNQLTSQSPLTLAGWTGLTISAVQVLPFEFLDGGNLAIAMYSHQQVRKIAQISRLLILAIALLIQPWLRVYALLLFLLPIPRPLVLNEGLSLDRIRDCIGLALMAIALLIILPLPR